MSILNKIGAPSTTIRVMSGRFGQSLPYIKPKNLVETVRSCFFVVSFVLYVYVHAPCLILYYSYISIIDFLFSLNKLILKLKTPL